MRYEVRLHGRGGAVVWADVDDRSRAGTEMYRVADENPGRRVTIYDTIEGRTVFRTRSPSMAERRIASEL